MPPLLGVTNRLSKFIRDELFVALPWVLLMPWGSWQSEHDALAPMTCLSWPLNDVLVRMMLRLWHL